jgi:2-keto-4-pentenoate hydratase
MEVVDFRIFRDKVQRLVQDSIADNAAFGAYILGDVPLKPGQVDLTLVPYIFEINHRQQRSPAVRRCITTRPSPWRGWQSASPSSGTP